MFLDEMLCHAVHAVPVFHADLVEILRSVLKTEHGTFCIFPNNPEKLRIHAVNIKRPRLYDDGIQRRIIR